MIAKSSLFRPMRNKKSSTTEDTKVQRRRTKPPSASQSQRIIRLRGDCRQPQLGYRRQPRNRELFCVRNKFVHHYLGIDGGGTKTTCAVGDETRLIAAATAGPSNIVRVGEAQARESLHQAVHQAC